MSSLASSTHIARRLALRLGCHTRLSLLFEVGVRPTPITATRSAAPFTSAGVLEEVGYWWFEEPVQHAADDRPHRQSPSCGKPDMTKPCEWNDPSPRQHAVFEKPPKPADGLFHLPAGPGLVLQINEAELAKRRVPIA